MLQGMEMVHIRHVCVPKDYTLMLINNELFSCLPVHSSLLDRLCDCKHKLTWQVPVLECYSAMSIF
jgi:SAM-dependent MidA family methyltransferase